MKGWSPKLPLRARDLTEVDFRPAANEPEDPLALVGEIHDQLERVQNAQNEMERVVREARLDQERWQRWQRKALFRSNRLLRKQLQAERANQFTDEDVLAALVEIDRERGGEVSASEIAARLLRAPTHSGVIRVGLALSRLSRAGRVDRIRGPESAHRAHRWSMKAEGGENDG